MDPQCLDHHHPPPMEKQKWWGQDSGLADLQEKMDTASCGEEETGDCPGPRQKNRRWTICHTGGAKQRLRSHSANCRARVERFVDLRGPLCAAPVAALLCGTRPLIAQGHRPDSEPSTPPLHVHRPSHLQTEVVTCPTEPRRF